jgi:hypothetical protein
VVYEVDPYCLEFEWDGVCESLAYDLCCAADVVSWLDPPDGVVDARQPHALHDSSDLWGIDTIHAQGVAGDDPKCWNLCETDSGGYEENAIWAVADLSDDTFVITLERPITPGAVTTISYAGGRSVGSFISHPGNANGDGEAGISDVIAVAEFLNGTGSLPWGEYSCDLNHDEECALSDIVRLIDLLDGTGDFDAWNGTLLPVDPGVCP